MYRLIVMEAVLFQLTAARRRLLSAIGVLATCYSFNSQPPEGGCPYQTGKE